MNLIFRTSFQLVALFSFAILSISGHAADRYETEKGNILVEKIIGNLNRPWAMAKLPDGQLLVSLRGGKLILISPGTVVNRIEVSGLPKIAVGGQGGVLDVILDKDFAKNNLIYFTFSEPGAGGRAGTALASAILVQNSKPSIKDVKILYSMKNKTRGGRHFGSRIVQAKDDTLYVTIGDRGDRDRAQDPFDAAGSVIRINSDGTIPADNPFINSKDALPEIWSVGHRNPQGATLNDTTGGLWTLSHGARGGDEINIPQAGKNYGWPTISYGTHYSGGKIGVGNASKGLEQPIYYWDPSIAPSGFDFYDGVEIPFWKGDLFAGGLKFGQISRLEVEGSAIRHEERIFDGEYGRIRDIRYFDDGGLWFLTDSDDGAIYRISAE